MIMIFIQKNFPFSDYIIGNSDIINSCLRQK